MIAPTVALNLLLAPALPVPSDSWQSHEAECRRFEDAVVPGSREAGAGYMAAGDACRRAFETVPDGEKALDQRSYFVFEAHRLYQLAHEAGHPTALCADLRAVDALAAQLAALEPGVRTRDRQDVEEIGQQITAQLVAPCEPEAAPERQIHGAPVSNADRTGTSEPARGFEPAPIGPTLRPPAPPTTNDRTQPRRPLKIAGGSAIGLGLGLGVGMIGALVHGAALHQQAASMTYKGRLIPEADAGQFKDIDARGHRADNAAIGLGVAGGVLAVVGVALVVVDARQSRAARRVALRSSILPTAGVRLTVEF